MKGILHTQYLKPPFRVLTLLFLFLSISFSAFSQYLRKDWDFDYGGTGWEECNSFIETSNGDYIMAGYTASDASGDISDMTFDMFPSPDVGDFWVIRTDANGALLDNRRYGGDRHDRLWSIVETQDGGFIMGGWSRSNIGGTKTEASFGEMDYWIVKLDQNLDWVWDRTYGGSSDDFIYELIQTSDGGFLAVGTSNSDISGSKLEPHYGQFDLWIVKLYNNGDLQWQNTIGGTEEERVNAVYEEAGGNFVIGGACESPWDGIDITEVGHGGKDYWVIKVDPLTGAKVWEKRYGGSEEDEIQAMVPVSTGGILMVGGSRSPATPGMKAEDSQTVDIWAVKVDDSGDIIEWERTLGGAEFDNCYSVKENTVGNFILGGYSQSDLSATKSSPNRGVAGTADFWVNYLAADGTQVWDQAFGGPESDVLEDVYQTSDGGYVLAGHSRSDIGGDKTDPTEGLNDYWIIKTLCDVSVDFQDTIACPNTDFILDARDPNCVLCDWQWEDNSGDSLRTININTAQTYAVTLTDGVGCQWSDDVNVGVHTVAGIEIGPDHVLCEGDSVQIGVGNNPQLIYTWNTGELTSEIFIDTSGIYKLEVTDPNGCIVEDSLGLVVNPVPIVNLGNDTALCAGATLELDAGPGFINYEWKPIPAGNIQTLTIYPTGPVTIGVEVENQFNCRTEDLIVVTDIFELPEVLNLSTDCAIDNSGYTLSFELSNNAPSDITLTGITGTWQGNIFTSDFITTGTGYDFYLENLNNCQSAREMGTSNCVCYSDAGQIDNTALDICGLSSGQLNFSGTFLDQDDFIDFVLHDGNTTAIGNILHTYSTAEIFNPGTITIGQTYYLAVRVGNAQGNSVDPNDGCISFSDGIPVIFHNNPTAVVSLNGPQFLGCDGSGIPLDGTFSVGNGTLDYTWITITGNIVDPINLSQVEVDAPGWYYLSVLDDNGCRGLDSILVEQDADVPDIVLSDPEMLNCNRDSTMISAAGSSSGSNFSLQWNGQNIDGLTDLSVAITEPGIYSLIIENTDTDCRNEETFTVFENLAAPNIEAGISPELSCATNQANLLGSFLSPCDNCQFSWSSINGQIVNGANQFSPTVEGTGWYFLSALHADTGCENIDSVLVIDNTNAPNNIILDANSPPCLEDEFGSLSIDQVSGGMAPYTYSLNGNLFQSGSVFEHLTPGNYELVVADNLGCTTLESFVIDPTTPVGVDLVNDFTINLGESIFLNPNMTPNVVDIIWAGAGTENCHDCLTQNLTPLERTEYIITVFDENGCEAFDRVLVEVKDDINVYIPNIFSPNNDGTNDNFAPQFVNTDNIQSIDNFSIADRWGAIIYSEKSISPDQIIGWDGKYNGQNLNPGVFVFMLKMTLINGESKIFKGDITLIK